jgi:hypothetical protein
MLEALGDVTAEDEVKECNSLEVADRFIAQRDDAVSQLADYTQEVLHLRSEREKWEKRARKLLRHRKALRAERDALRKDAARLDWMADAVVVEAFGIDDVDAAAGFVGMDIYEHASIVADERGNDDDPTVSDKREGFRRMIDAVMEDTP